MQQANPFGAMTSALTQVGRVDRVTQNAPPEHLNSHAATMRQAMQAGPLGTAELAAAAGVRRALVQSLLKWDLRIGRVVKAGAGNTATYALGEAHHADDQRREHEAIALLRRRGYSVTKAGTC